MCIYLYIVYIYIFIGHADDAVGDVSVGIKFSADPNPLVVLPLSVETTFVSHTV